MAGTTANLGAVAIERTPRLGGNHVAMTHLAQMWKRKLNEGQVFLGDVIHKAFSAKRYIKATPLLSALNGLGKDTDFAQLKTKKVEISGIKWTWYLESHDETCVHVVDNIETNPFPGFGTTAGGDVNSFRIRFDKPWPRASEVYAPRSKNYQVRIKAYHGGDDINGYLYEVQLLQSTYCPTEYLTKNERWVKIGPGLETEAAVEGGGIQFPNKFKFENVLTTFRQTFSMTGDAMLAEAMKEQKADDSMMVMKYNYMDKAGKPSKNAFWIHKGEERFWSTWFRHIEVALWYGQKITNTIRNRKGHNIIGGAGVRELLKFSNQYYTTEWTASLYEDFLDNIQFDRVSPGGDREIHGYAGSRAISKLHQALKGEQIKTLVSTDIELQKVKSRYHKNAFAYGLQYTQYHMTNGAILKLMHNPIYDDRRINTQEHPTEKGKPAESYKITFFDLDPESSLNHNVSLVEQKDYKGFWVVDGATPGSFTSGSSTSVAHLGSWASCATAARLGIWIKDLTACGEIQLALNF